jgi:hypothetical protein
MFQDELETVIRTQREARSAARRENFAQAYENMAALAEERGEHAYATDLRHTAAMHRGEA